MEKPDGKTFYGCGYRSAPSGTMADWKDSDDDWKNSEEEFQRQTTKHGL